MSSYEFPQPAMQTYAVFACDDDSLRSLDPIMIFTAGDDNIATGMLLSIKALPGVKNKFRCSRLVGMSQNTLMKPGWVKDFDAPILQYIGDITPESMAFMERNVAAQVAVLDKQDEKKEVSSK